MYCKLKRFFNVFMLYSTDYDIKMVFDPLYLMSFRNPLAAKWTVEILLENAALRAEH